MKAEFRDPGSKVVLGIRFENSIAVVVKIKVGCGSLTLQDSFLPPSHGLAVPVANSASCGDTPVS